MGPQWLTSRQVGASKVRSVIASPTRTQKRCGRWTNVSQNPPYLTFPQAKHNIELAQVAQRWLQHHSAIGPGDSVIIGASGLKQLEDNIKDWYVASIFFIWAFRHVSTYFHLSEGGPLPDEIVKALDDAWVKAKAVGGYYASA